MESQEASVVDWGTKVEHTLMTIKNNTCLATQKRKVRKSTKRKGEKNALYDVEKQGASVMD